MGLSGVEHLAAFFFCVFSFSILFVFFALRYPTVPIGERSGKLASSSLLYVCVCVCVCVCVLSLYTPGLRNTTGPSESFYLLHRKKRNFLNTLFYPFQPSPSRVRDLICDTRSRCRHGYGSFRRVFLFSRTHVRRYTRYMSLYLKRINLMHESR